MWKTQCIDCNVATFFIFLFACLHFHRLLTCTANECQALGLGLGFQTVQATSCDDNKQEKRWKKVKVNLFYEDSFDTEYNGNYSEL